MQSGGPAVARLHLSYENSVWRPRARGLITTVRRDDAMLACIQMCGLKATQRKTQVTSSKSFPSITHRDQPCSQRSCAIHMTSGGSLLHSSLSWQLVSEDERQMWEETIPHKLHNKITWVVTKSFPGLYLSILRENHIWCLMYQRKIRPGESNQIAKSF